MKKKYLLIVLLVISVFTLTGCFDKQESSKKKKKNTESLGRIYEQVSLEDHGITVFNGIIPQEWTAEESTDWTLVNSTIPGVAYVKLTSPDESTSIIIISRHSFVENLKYNEGINKDYYTTYLHKMNASEYIEYYMESNYPNASYSDSVDVPESTISALSSYNKMKFNAAEKDAQAIQAQAYNIDISVRNDGVTIAKEIYEDDDNIYEVFTGVTNITTILKSGLSSLLDSSATTWEMPYFIIYQSDSEDNFEKYYDDYNFIIANSSFTTDFYAMVEYVSSCIVNYYTSIYAERSKAALQATNDFIDSNYSSTSSASTNEKVMEMWDDVIKEVDSYKLEDGTTLKTSIQTETVAQNGNEIYIGDKAGIPIGFQTVGKGY